MVVGFGVGRERGVEGEGVGDVGCGDEGLGVEGGGENVRGWELR